MGRCFWGLSTENQTQVAIIVYYTKMKHANQQPYETEGCDAIRDVFQCLRFQRREKLFSRVWEIWQSFVEVTF